jgi:hypothetical protein
MEALAALARKLGGFMPVGTRVVGSSGDRFVFIAVDGHGPEEEFTYDRALKICQTFAEIDRELNLPVM